MYSVMLIALLGIAPSSSARPVWIADYGEARRLSEINRKPIAVFIGAGTTGWNDVSREGRLGVDTGHLLATNYVCVYVDTASQEGRRLAQAFQLDKSRGIVISNSQGKLQAFRHEGDLRDLELAHYLKRFSNPDLVVLQTETNPPKRSLSTPAVKYSSSSTRGC
jgi:hypothetical protein